MVRSIDGALTTAIGADNRTPSITMSFQDRVQHYLAYQSSANADQWVDACIANDNSIVRVTITRAGATSDIRVQRITDPTVITQWSTWTTLTGSSGNMQQDNGCAISNSGGTIRAFGQRGTGGAQLWAWTSTDNGATWTGPVSVLTPPGSANCRGIGSAGNNDVWFLYDVAGGEAIGLSTWNGAAWTAIHTINPTPVPTGGNGICAYWSNPYHIIYSDGQALYSGTYDPGSTTWTQSIVVAPAASTLVQRISPRISAIDGLFYLIFIEKDTGSVTGTIYHYPRVKQSLDAVHWSSGFILHALTGQYGANILKTNPQTGSAGLRYYAANGVNVYSATAYSALDPNKFLDVSASLLNYKRTEKPEKPAEIILEIDNNHGVYNGLVTVIGTATLKPIGPDSTIVLAEGYLVGGPPPTVPDLVTVGRYHMQQVEFLRTPEENIIRIMARDLSRNLDLVCRWQTTYTNQTISYLVKEVCARAGLFTLVVPSTTQMSQTIGSFILKAGQTFRQALSELCQTYNLVYFMDHNEVMQFIEKNSADGSVWLYQPEVESAGWVTNDERANHIIVSGKPPAAGLGLGPAALTEGEAYDDIDQVTVLYERVLHHVDTKLTTTAQCVLKANFLLAEEQRAQYLHSAVVPANPALQMYDGVQLNDYVAPTGTGQSGVFRLIGSEVTYSPEHGMFEHHLAFEGI